MVFRREGCVRYPPPPPCREAKFWIIRRVVSKKEKSADIVPPPIYPRAVSALTRYAHHCHHISSET